MHTSSLASSPSSCSLLHLPCHLCMHSTSPFLSCWLLFWSCTLNPSLSVVWLPSNWTAFVCDWRFRTATLSGMRRGCRYYLYLFIGYVHRFCTLYDFQGIKSRCHDRRLERVRCLLFMRELLWSTSCCWPWPCSPHPSHGGVRDCIPANGIEAINLPFAIGCRRDACSFLATRGITGSVSQASTAPPRSANNRFLANTGQSVVLSLN